MRIFARLIAALAAVAAVIAAIVLFDPSRTAPGNVIRPPFGDLPDEIFVPDCNERRVETADQLEQVLRSDFVGCVTVVRDKFLNMTGRSFIPIKTGVTLRGERGELGSRPSLFTDAGCSDPKLEVGNEECRGYSLFEITGNNIKVQGLHLRGPSHGSRSSAQPYVNAISIVVDPDAKLGRDLYITENEMDEWPGAGVGISSTRRARTPEQYLPEWARLTPEEAALIRIERNFFHHNARDGGGYGVSVGTGARATIIGNVFDFNRHAVASNGFANSGYVARFNYILQGGFKQGSYYNQHFDVHGTSDTDGDDKSTGYGGSAGDYYEIAYNAIRGDQEYYCFIVCLKTRPAFMLRGKPVSGARFDANVLTHDDLDAAVSLKKEKNDTGYGEHHDEFNFDATGNQFSTDRSGHLATGDFDGDKRTDVFVATGTAWFFSRGGQEAWEFLHASNKLTRELGFADIDNDGTTDVLYRDGAGNLGFLKSGRTPLRPLTTTPVPMPQLRFGDFDGDGLTDIFYTHQRRWKIWYGNVRDWRDAQSSGFAVSDFLFGEFDSVPGTDIVVITGGKWQISSNALGGWAYLNERRRSTFRGAVVADFDGDGKSDIAFDDGSQMWSFSSGGASPLRALREGDGQPAAYPPLGELLAGHFDGDNRAEVLSWYAPTGASGPVFDNHFMIWRGGRRDRFERLSWHAMR